MRGMLATLLLFVGCSTLQGPDPVVVVQEVEDVPVPGTVYGAWNEQMIDSVSMPGSLDPEGTYYRIPHQTIVEYIPGRGQRVQFPSVEE